MLSFVYLVVLERIVELMVVVEVAELVEQDILVRLVIVLA
jgi:hypothetical protein